MFHHGDHTARQHALSRRTAKAGNLPRIAAITTISQKCVGILACNIERGRTVAIDTQIQQLSRNQPVAQIHCLFSLRLCLGDEIERR